MKLQNSIKMRHLAALHTSNNIPLPAENPVTEIVSIYKAQTTTKDLNDFIFLPLNPTT